MAGMLCRNPQPRDYSVSATGELTRSVWMRPDTLNFPENGAEERFTSTGSARATASGKNGNQEWTFRMYNHSIRSIILARTNRISFYLFNPRAPRLGSSCSPLHKGQWIQVTSVADATRTISTATANSFAATLRGPQQGLARSTSRTLPTATSTRDRTAGGLGSAAGSALRTSAAFSRGAWRGCEFGAGAGAHEIAHSIPAIAAPLDGLVANSS